MKYGFSPLLSALIIGALLVIGLFSPLSLPRMAQARPALAGAIHHVAPLGTECGGATPCFANIQKAVDSAAPGDEIRVAAGVYTGVSFRNNHTQLVYVDKTVRIRGGYDPQTWVLDPAQHFTILDAQSQGRVITVIGDVAPTIEGLRMTNGAAPMGGGVYIDQAAVSLNQNTIYSNTALAGPGGGIFVQDSPVVISGNEIISNTAQDNGRGGGIALWDSSGQVLANTIRANRALVGAGIQLSNRSGVLVMGNTIVDNVGVDYERQGQTFSSAGGGAHIGDGSTDILRSNLISGNTAAWGGGIYSFSASPIINNNTIAANSGTSRGGGLYVQWGLPIIQNNRVLSNTTSFAGGGLDMWANGAVVANNLFQGNVSDVGGGLYVRGGNDVDGNVFRGNRATYTGGGLFVLRGGCSLNGCDAESALFRNNVFLTNHAQTGGGLYIWGATVDFVQTTIAGNTGEKGQGVVIDQYPGLSLPSALDQLPATVAFTNTILVNHTVGIFATSGNTATVDGVLWFNTPTPVDAAGATVTVQNEFTGDPRFMDDGYHLQHHHSAAADRGVVVNPAHNMYLDIDGEARPIGGYELGADEIPLSAPVTPQVGGVFFFTSTTPFHATEVTITIPPGAVTSPLTLRLTPFAAPPPWMITSVFNGHIPVGLPFRLLPFEGNLLLPPVDFDRPVTVSVHYSGVGISAIKPDSRIYAVFWQEDQGNYRVIPVDCPAPGGTKRSADTGSDFIATVYICNTGGHPTSLPPHLLPAIGGWGQSLAAGASVNEEGEGEFVYFVILAEPDVRRIFLPTIQRDR